VRILPLGHLLPKRIMDLTEGLPIKKKEIVEELNSQLTPEALTIEI